LIFAGEMFEKERFYRCFTLAVDKEKPAAEYSAAGFLRTRIRNDSSTVC
jgi:hypothetical protein